jgi:hypothetical protein
MLGHGLDADGHRDSRRRRTEGKTKGRRTEETKRDVRKKIKKEKQEALKSFYSSCLSDEVVSPNNFSKTTKFHRKSCL